MEFDGFASFEDFLDHMASLFDEFEANEENERRKKEKHETSIIELNHELNAMNSKGNYDVCARDYVTILELIRNIVTYISNNSILNKDLKEKIYGKILEEIEPALDDLTLGTLQIVINQYNTIQSFEQNLPQSQDKSRNHYISQTETKVAKEHKKFQKIITKHQG